MIANDKKKEHETMTIMADYLAAFWNPEAVKKIQEIRNSESNHSFQSDKEFEESLVTGEYKNNPILDAVIKMRKLEKGEDDLPQQPENNMYPRSKSPTNLSSIKTMLEKFGK